MSERQKGPGQWTRSVWMSNVMAVREQKARRLNTTTPRLCLVR